MLVGDRNWEQVIIKVQSVDQKIRLLEAGISLQPSCDFEGLQATQSQRTAEAAEAASPAWSSGFAHGCACT